MPDHWELLMEVYDRTEAEIIHEALRAQGIYSSLFQEGIAHYLYPGISSIQICVPSEQLDEARGWLVKYQADTLDQLEISHPDSWSEMEKDPDTDPDENADESDS